jgi:SAM-dependent methyltransferase
VSPPHWFEPVAEHLGSAYLRYSFTTGTEQEVRFLLDHLGIGAGAVVLDVGCGPGRHLRALRARGVTAVGVDISRRFVELAGPPVVRGDARALPVRPGSFDAAISLCQGGFGLPDPAHALEDDRSVLAGIAAALRPGGRVALTAFSAYFQLRYLEADRDHFDAATGVNHERTEVRSEQGEPAQVDLWTACYTPRELRLLAAAVGLEVEQLWSVEPGRYATDPPRLDRPELLLVARRPATAAGGGRA